MSTEKKPEFEFPDATKVYNQRTHVGGLMVYSAMMKASVEGPDGGRHWCQTMVIDPTVKPMVPIVNMTHSTFLEAAAVHNSLVAAMKMLEKVVKSPLSLEIDALNTALIASEAELAQARKLLECPVGVAVEDTVEVETEVQPKKEVAKKKAKK